MKINKGWHLAHRMPKNPKLGERIDWHVEHLKNCACRDLTPKLKEEFRKRKISIKDLKKEQLRYQNHFLIPRNNS
jgi:hypothetical protein